MDKKSFVLYSDYDQHIELLTMEERGYLLTALLNHAKGEPPPPDMTPITTMAYSFISAQIDRDNEKWASSQDKRSAAAKAAANARWDNKDTSESLGQDKGAREPEKKPVYPSMTSPEKQGALDDEQLNNANACQRMPTHATASARMRRDAIDALTVTVTDTVTDTVTNPPLPPQGAHADASKSNNLQQERFNNWWQHYPKKVGKQAARKAWNKIKPDAALYDRIIDATKAQAHCGQWRKENGRFIPNPATWLNQGRWDDDLTALNSGGKTIGNRDFSGHQFEDYDALEE